MHTLAELTSSLNCSNLGVRRLQTRFALPVLEGAAYSAAYMAFLRTILFLRIFGVTEDALLRLWQLEKKLLVLLNADSTGSPTWFLDACGETSHRRRRLLLTNYDLGVAIPSRMLQPGLNFGDGLPELFLGKEMGEDAFRIVREYLKAASHIRGDIAGELPHTRAAVAWGKALLSVPETPEP